MRRLLRMLRRRSWPSCGSLLSSPLRGMVFARSSLWKDVNSSDLGRLEEEDEVRKKSSERLKFSMI